MSPRPCSINYVEKRNKYSVSYGLVVFTNYPTKRVMLVERKIPYCLQNHLWKIVNDKTFNTLLVSTPEKETKTIRIRNNTPMSSIVKYIRKFVNSYKVEDLKLNKPFEMEDFIKYKTGKVFEDKYDFPHGQMTKRAKSYLNRKIEYWRKNCNNNNNNNNLEEKENLLKKFAGFITAFTEFEEETDHTFRFDSDMIKKDVIEMVLKFKGLDDFIYEQHFYILTVDKIEKMKPEQRSSSSTTRVKIFHDRVSREVDRVTYEPKCVDVEEAKKLLLFQQHDMEKVDLKHMLLCCFSCDDDYNCLFMKKNLNKFSGDRTTTTFENENISDSEDEEMFLHMVKHIEPKVYIKSVRRRRWRDH